MWDGTDVDGQRLLVPFQRARRRKGSVDASMVDSLASCQSGISYIALDYARLLMCEKRPMWHHQIPPEIVKHPFAFLVVTLTHWVGVFWLFSISSFYFFVEWAFNGAIELLPGERFFILRFFFFFFFVCFFFFFFFFFLGYRRKKSRRSLTKRKEPSSLASGHIWSPHDVSFFSSLNSLLRCPSSLLW